MRSLLIVVVIYTLFTLQCFNAVPTPQKDHHNNDKKSANHTDKASEHTAEINEVSNMKEKINAHQDSIHSTPTQQHKSDLAKPQVKSVAKRAVIKNLSARRKRDVNDYLQEPIVVEDLEDLALLINALQRLNDLNAAESESSQNLYQPEEEELVPTGYDGDTDGPELIPESVARALLSSAEVEPSEALEEPQRYERPRRGGFRYGGYGRSPFRSSYYRRSLRSPMPYEVVEDENDVGGVDDAAELMFPLANLGDEEDQVGEDQNLEEMLDEAELEDRIATLARAILSREGERRRK